MAPARHLLHVFATFGRGGPQIRFCQVVGRCPAGWRHTLIAMDGNTDALDGVPVPIDVVPRPEARGFLAAGRAFKSVIRELGPDLVCTYNWGAIEAVAGARAARAPIVHHEDGFGPDELVARKRRRNWMRRFLLRSARRVIVPSAVLGGIARSEWGVDEARLALLPNGVDLERFRPPGARPERPLTIGTVGGLRPEKDQANLLDAFAQVRANGLDARLRIVGDGPVRADLEARAETLGIADYVAWDGALADPSEAYRGLDVFALPSKTEQMPLCLLEAMATGLPVVATDVGDVRSILAEPNRRHVVPARDATALARALAAVAGDAEQRAALGRANRARAAEAYELVACMDAFAAVYAAALA